MVADEIPTPEGMWAPGGLASQPEDVSYHYADTQPTPAASVLRGRVAACSGAWEGGLGPNAYYR